MNEEERAFLDYYCFGTVPKDNELALKFLIKKGEIFRAWDDCIRTLPVLLKAGAN